MQMFLSILSKVFMGFVILVAIFIVGSFLPKVFPIQNYTGGWYTFRVVVSGSMTPTIPVGSVVATWPTGNYQVGDVVTFHLADNGSDLPTSHRIVKIEHQGSKTLYTTKGDANNSADYRKKEKGDILGKVFFHVPYLGYVANFVKLHTWGTILVLIVLIVVWVAWDFFRK
jgi:signal peptidase